MSKIKVSEIFYSIQGEGRYMGVPSIFLRTFGCNFTCGGFGMPTGKISDERNAIKAGNFKNYRSLPLVHTGCDSYASWDPNFKEFSSVMSSDDIVRNIIALLPNNSWGDIHLVITGGEPLLGWQRAYPDLLNHPDMRKLQAITFETNGTQPLSPELAEYLTDWQWRDPKLDAFDREVTFSVSPKLSGSGEKHKDAIKPEIVCEYQVLAPTYLKFVITTEEDAQEALNSADEYYDLGFHGAIYFMPVGGVESVYHINNRRVAELAMKYGVRYSDRLQVPLFKNAHGT